MPRYPTPEQIMERRFVYKRGVIPATRSWKRRFFQRRWRNLSDKDKFTVIAYLLTTIDTIYNPNGQGGLRSVIPGPRACYIPLEQIIVLDAPSIVSALHELGHHLFGASELTACRFSAQLFQRVFPRQFNRLTWQGHLLVRQG